MALLLLPGRRASSTLAGTLSPSPPCSRSPGGGAATPGTLSRTLACVSQRPSNNPCHQAPAEGVTCAMGLEELCKGTLNLQTMYGKSLGYLPDAETTCCTASVFSAECTSVCRSMVQLLKNCHRFREATFDAEKLPSHSDPDATAAICDACLYVSPTEEVPAAAALRSRLEVFPGDALNARPISF